MRNDEKLEKEEDTEQHLDDPKGNLEDERCGGQRQRVSFKFICSEIRSWSREVWRDRVDDDRAADQEHPMRQRSTRQGGYLLLWVFSG